MSRLDEIDLSSGSAVTSIDIPEPAPPRKNKATAQAAPPEERLARAAVQSSAPGFESPGFVDLPLRSGPAEPAGPRGPTAEPADSEEQALAAPLSARLAAFAADGALVLLLVAAALLAATAGRGRMLEVSGLLWTAVFALYLSFFSTVVPLMLFGKTVGMSLTGLTARGPRGSSPLTAAQAARRWLGTALTLVALGSPLLATRRDRSAPSPGDRLSGRPLTAETVDRQ